MRIPDLCGSPLRAGEDGIQVSVDATFDRATPPKPYPCRVLSKDGDIAYLVLGGVNQAGRVFLARVRVCNGVGWSGWSPSVLCRAKAARPQAPQQSTVKGW